jgi:hypothetical protein
MLKYLACGGLAMLALWPAGVSAAPAWEQWQPVGGVFDLGGPRSDGALVVAGSGELYTLAAAGVLAPFAHGEDPGAEAYLAVSPGTGCFARDETFILRLDAPIGVTRVSADGSTTTSFASVGTSSLNGIAFDTAGSFDHRLLVTAPVNGRTEVVAIDCSGAALVITKTAPVAEGGLAVAPEAFGSFGGDLIMPDELSGLIWAVAPDGSAKQVVASGLPKGQDTGVESLAFVPAGFTGRGGFVYYSDRATPGNPHAGTDHVLRLSSAELVAAGVQDGDLLAATEGGASMIDVRCAASCAVTRVVSTPTTAHGEGHLAFTMTAQPSPSPVSVATQHTSASAPAGPPLAPIFVVAGVAVAAAVIAFLFMRRRT